MSYPSQTNPYAAPQAINPFGEAQPVKPAGPPLGLWRQGNVLVMHKQAPLPDICVKSNLPAQRRLKRTLYWHHPMIYLAILAHVLIYVILAACLRKKAVIEIPLTDEWHRRRWMWIAIGWAGALLGVGMFITGITVAESSPNVGVPLIISSFFVFLGAGIGGILGARHIRSSRMTDDYVWIKGIHPGYLDRLPVWPYQI